MSVAFPEVRVGAPIGHDQLAVFPLFAELASGVEYDLSDTAINEGTVTVEEVSESGSVPELAVENKGERRVLFLEGEELVGAKQNRILNASVLVAAHSKSKIPVSCVEAGRWGYKSRHFGSGGTHSPTRLRRVLKASVSRSARSQHGYRSDQRGVWDEISRQQAALGAQSETHAMSDTFAAYQERLTEYQANLHYVDGAIGVAIAVGGKVVTVDLFDKESTCAKIWHRLLSGAILDALEVKETQMQAECAEVERALGNLANLSWDLTESIGDGDDYRAESSAGDHASALVFDGMLVHGSVVCAP